MSEQRAKPYPIALTRLNHVRCVVVGGGEVAVRKVRALLGSGAQVRVISPDLHPHLAEWHAADQIEYVARPYQAGDVEGAFLVIAATNVREVNRAVAQEASDRGILVNVADEPSAGNFFTMGAVTRGDVLLAVSTGGESPALSAHIRRKLEHEFGPEYGLLAERLGQLRQTVIDTVPAEQRPQFWRALVSDEVLGWLRDGQQDRFEEYIQSQIKEQRLRMQN